MPDTTSELNCTDLLGRLPLFQGLSDAERGALGKNAQVLFVPRGKIVFQRGEPSHGMYLVLEGQVKLFITSTQGREKVLELLGVGQCFGEAVMFMERPYPVTAQTLQDSVLMLLSRQAIFDEMKRSPAMGLEMVAGLSARLHMLINSLETISLMSGRERVVGYLLGEAPENTANSISFDLPVSKGEIASYLNLTQEHFSRILRELINEGLLGIKGRRVLIPDLERLRHARLG